MSVELSPEELRLIAITLSEHIISIKGEAVIDKFLNLLEKIDHHRALPE